ncbi:sugar-transfer associated ATP-grasp domain-containing protein [Nitrosomonas sp.]|uniref:sugar-transfer associated ATP-grasp domain-containing protein n=1 Tax=Nitrosomonas sp. TaxID=42353 RepID=UPI003A5BBDEF
MAIDLGFDRIVRDLSGARWTFFRLSEDDTAATSIHLYFRFIVWREASRMDRCLMLAALPFLPFLIIILAVVFTALNGYAIKKRTGKGIFRQVGEQIGVACRYAILPPWYYIFELHDDDKRQRANEYLNRFETKATIYRFMRDNNGGLPVPAERSTQCIRDKTLFMAHCRKNGVAAAPILWIIKEGKIITMDWKQSGFPEFDLFVKPLNGQGGRGTIRWDYLGSGQFFCNDGSRANGNQVLEILRQNSERTAYIVQPRLINHPEIVDLACGALATVRVMSCRNETGGYEVTNAVFRMKRYADVIVDNYHAGGIAANVDINTGVLGEGTRGGWGVVTDGWYEQHPLSHTAISQRKLPCWEMMIDFVQDAHNRLFPDQVVIGWDVAILENGPCLIEANKAPDLDIIQRAQKGPLGNERLGELLAFNLKRTVEAKYEH